MNLNDIIKEYIQCNKIFIQNMPSMILYSRNIECCEAYTEQIKNKIIKELNIYEIYNKRMKIIDYKDDYDILMSQIHFEIDFELLGCNAKTLFQLIFKQIEEYRQLNYSKYQNKYLIVCKNFHKIHQDLMDCLYSYIQRQFLEDENYVWIFETENVSIIPKEIYDYCLCVGIQEDENKQKQKISIDKMKNKLIKVIDNFKMSNLDLLRNTLYDILIYQIDFHEILKEIIFHYIDELDDEKIYEINILLMKVLKRYNNNYRPIFHLETIILNLIKLLKNAKSNE